VLKIIKHSASRLTTNKLQSSLYALWSQSQVTQFTKIEYRGLLPDIMILTSC